MNAKIACFVSGLRLLSLAEETEISKEIIPLPPLGGWGVTDRINPQAYSTRFF